MNIAQELERLSQLHANGALTAEEFTRAKELLLKGDYGKAPPFRGIRRSSARRIFGLPLWDIALGPDWQNGEMRGHARGIIALGDIATGWIACGGLARGFLAFGGLALGLFAFGGCAIGLGVAFGGAALGGLAFGGMATGGIAIGGVACAYYALGEVAIGVHVLAANYQDPAAISFFQQYLPWVTKLIFRQ